MLNSFNYQNSSPNFRPSRLFDHIPGGYYFSKDKDGKFIYCNQNLLKLFNFSSFDDLLGKTDFEILRYDLAEEYRQEDEMVMQEGQGYFNKTNLVVDQQGNISTFITTKVPLKNDAGEVVGIEGFMQLKPETVESAPKLEMAHPFKNCLEYIENYFNENISIQTLADKSHMSKSTFSRKFRETFGESPSSYIKQFRLEMACKFLKAGHHLSEVANRCGFCDQSHFTKDFRQYTSLTPRQYQLKYKSEAIGLVAG
jgi:AraC-like DNA-binding protein